jgi:hypothetical protein
VRKRKKRVEVVDGQTVKQAANPLKEGEKIKIKKKEEEEKKKSPVLGQ